MMILAGSLIVSSCTKYPSETERLDEDLVVYTQYDVNADFSQYNTFAVPDSIRYYTDNDSGFVKNSNTSLIVDQIIQNMTNRGYTQVDTDENPDLGFNITLFENTNVTVYYYDPYYWYYPWYGYDYYYPYYPYYVSVYETGSIVIDMADFKNINIAEEKIPVPWNIFIRALLTDTPTMSDITGSIDQAFEQTPEIHK
jgi:hypothetical protein